MRTLIVNADDLGLCPSVNTAIFDVFRAGNLSSATLMVNMPGTLDAVRRAKELPALGIGLHFCITEGTALTGSSSITRTDGSFMGRNALVQRAVQGRLDAGHLQGELQAQLDKARELGIQLTHVDSHQHVHMLPAIFRAMLPVLERSGLPVRMVDPPRGAVLASMSRPRKALKQWLNLRFAARDRARFTGRTNDVLVSIHDLDHPGPYDASTYAGLLKSTSAEEVVEVMVHPYILGDDVLGMYAAQMEMKLPFLKRCEAEHRALSLAPVFRDARLITYAQL